MSSHMVAWSYNTVDLGRWVQDITNVLCVAIQTIPRHVSVLTLTMAFRRAAAADELAVCRRLMPTWCRLQTRYRYRYVAAASIACIICITHLIVNQSFLSAQKTDDLTAVQYPSTVDAVVHTSRTPTTLDAFDWGASHDTGCDSMIRSDSDDAHHVVCVCRHRIILHQSPFSVTRPADHKQK